MARDTPQKIEPSTETDVLSQEKVSEIARRALKGLVAQGQAPIPPLYERAFYAMALEMGAEDIVSYLQSKLPPGQATVALVEGLARTIAELNNDIQRYREYLEAHGEELEDWHKGLKAVLEPSKWATLQKEISALRLAHTMMVQHLEATEKRLVQRETEIGQLQRTTRYDPVTGTMNRRAMEEDLSSEFSRCHRYGRSFSMIMADIDTFKHINDTYGHVVGDEILRAFARLMAKGLRQVDALYRYGGEEFAVLLPETGEDGGLKVADRLRQRIEFNALKSRSAPEVGIRITASFGVATYRQGDATPADIIDRADKALYRAKAAGRNRVEFAGGDA